MARANVTTMIPRNIPQIIAAVITVGVVVAVIVRVPQLRSLVFGPNG